MSLRGSTVQTRRRIMVRNAYTSSNLDLTDDDLVLIRDRDNTIEELTIEEMIERFEEMPSVQTYGILRVERDKNGGYSVSGSTTGCGFVRMDSNSISHPKVVVAELVLALR